MSTAEIDAMVTKLRNIPEVLRQAVKPAAEAFGSALKGALSSGAAPGGAAWKSTKAGGRPLANAAAHVTTKAVGQVILSEVTDYHVFHHKGTAKLPARPMLPKSLDTFPEGAEAIKGALIEAFEKASGK